MTNRQYPAAAPSSIICFAILLVFSGVFWWQPLYRTLELALSNEAYTHILLILPVSFGLVFLERTQLTSSPVPGLAAIITGVTLVLLVAGLAKWATIRLPADVGLSLSVFALVVSWIASFVFCFGKRAFRSLLFPLCFLFWIVPLPSVAVDEVIYFLQQQSALAARIMFLAVGVPVTQDGVMLSIPNLDIEVARECSSIRSSMLLVIITMILAHLFLRSWWSKAVLVAAAIPMTAIKNGFRIFAITELATRVDPQYFEGNLHRRGGILFLGVALAMMVGLLWGLRRTEAVSRTKL
jgi:exosortase